jgi:hypothetical protein
MNNLQKYIKLRGTTPKAIAEAVGLNYHSVQKTVKGQRHSWHVKAAVARHLGIDPLLLWSDNAQDIKNLIAQEIERRAAEERVRLRARYLGTKARIPNNRRASND